MRTQSLHNTIHPPLKPRGPRARRALTLLEVVISTLIVGAMAVAALQSLGAATRSGESAGNYAVALGLADELMAEVLSAPYHDPDDTTTFGPDSGESGGTRANFDDVDDFNGWGHQPPVTTDGTTIPNRDDWKRSVLVDCVEPDDPTDTTTGNGDKGVKRIRVLVEYEDNLLVEQIAIKTDDQ